MAVLKVLGETFLVKLLRAPRYTKPYTLAIPPPWFRKPEMLSNAQLTQVVRFSKAAHESAGKKLAERMEYIRRTASGPTGVAKPKAVVVLPRFGKIATIATKRGIAVPEELRKAATVTV